MAQPRLVLPNEWVLSTARTNCRFYLLRPDRVLVLAVQFCVAFYALKYRISVAAGCLMSTHLHLLFLDRDGHRSLFLRDVHRSIARFVKAYRGWSGPVFAPKPNIVRLLTPQAVLDKLAYLRANPVAAGAVRYSIRWPGWCDDAFRPSCRAKTLQRPVRYFGEHSELPDSVQLQLEVPDILIQHFGSFEAAKAALDEESQRQERQARALLQTKGWAFLGAERCLKLSPFRRAKAYEVFGDRVPSFATKGGGRKTFLEAVEQLKRFRAAYRAALEAWRDGHRDVLFPFGTWLMRVFHGVRCEPAWPGG